MKTPLGTLVAAGVIFVTAGLWSGPPLSARATPPSTPADRFTAKLLANRYALWVHGGELSGAGAPGPANGDCAVAFRAAGRGPRHCADSGIRVSRVCSAAGPDAFHTMAVEEGPLVAAGLERWARRPDGLAQMVAFQKQFPSSLNVSDEEFDMLQQCARTGQGEFDLWGLNQEGLNAGGLILSRVLAEPPWQPGSPCNPATASEE